MILYEIGCVNEPDRMQQDRKVGAARFNKRSDDLRDSL